MLNALQFRWCYCNSSNEITKYCCEYETFYAFLRGQVVSNKHKFLSHVISTIPNIRGVRNTNKNHIS